MTKYFTNLMLLLIDYYVCCHTHSSGWPLATRVERMILDDVLPNACAVDTDVFRERVSGTKVVAVLDAHKKWLRIIFAKYAAADDSDGAVLQADTINVVEAMKMCTDAALIGATLNVRAVRSIFAYVQQEELLDDDAEASGTASTVDEGEQVVHCGWARASALPIVCCCLCLASCWFSARSLPDITHMNGHSHATCVLSLPFRAPPSSSSFLLLLLPSFLPSSSQTTKPPKWSTPNSLSSSSR